MYLLKFILILVLLIISINAHKAHRHRRDHHSKLDSKSITLKAVPVVLWHGMGDCCCNPLSMGRVVKEIEKEVEGIYVKSLMLGENIASDVEKGFFANMNDIINYACEQIKNDTLLSQGYNIVGFSQGGQFVRALAERCPNPPIKNLISIGGQQQGVFGLPHCIGDTYFCNAVRRLLDLGAYLSYVQKNVVQAQYWHDSNNEKEYQKKSIFLADINNEVNINESYRKNLMKIKNLVLVKFAKDTMVVPKDSSWFGYYKANDIDVIEQFNETRLYKEDRIGLKQLFESGRVHFLEVDGDHLQFPAGESDILEGSGEISRNDPPTTTAVALQTTLSTAKKIVVSKSILKITVVTRNLYNSDTLDRNLEYVQKKLEEKARRVNVELPPKEKLISKAKNVAGKFAVLYRTIDLECDDVKRFVRYNPSEKVRNLPLEIEKLQNFPLANNLATAGTPIYDFDDLAYMINVTLGTPGQSFNLFLDSGSSNLWVPDKNCTGGEDSTCGTYCKTVSYDSCISFCQPKCCHNLTKNFDTTNACTTKHLFYSEKSSTYQSVGDSFDVIYKTGEVKGFYGKDTFCLGSTQLCATNQQFVQATFIGADFAKQPEDGMIGLAWGSIADKQVTPPMFNLMNQGKLDQPYFTIYMVHAGFTATNNGGTFTAGDLDTKNCKNDVNWIPLTSQTFWQFKLNGVSAGSYSVAPDVGFQAMSSSAASFNGAPKAVLDKIAHNVGATYIPTSGAYIIGCEHQGPDIIFSINGQEYHMPSSSYIISVGGGPCLFAFFPLTAGGFAPSFMLGPSFIRQFCQIHDMQGARLGMATAIQQN